MTARADLQWWNHFLQLWNGVSIFPTSLPKCNVFTDASGSFGCGALDPCLGAFQVQWPAAWADVDISVKEVVPLVFAAALWGPAWTGCHVQFHVDNMAVVNMIQKCSVKNDLLTHFLCCLCFYGAYFHFEFSASHVSTLSQLHYVLRGMCHLCPTRARQRQPSITIEILRLLFSRWSSPVTYEGIMLWAACTLAFFGFLRSGEFIPTRHYPCPLAVDDF